MPSRVLIENRKAVGIRVPAIKVHQNGNDLFMVDLTAEELLRYSQVDKWAATQTATDRGYQRQEMQAHYNKVGRYLNNVKNAILPTSILLNVRGDVDFKPLEADSPLGYLSIKNFPLWVVDGQHRIAGLRHAIEDLGNESVREFKLPTIIMAGMPKFGEVQQFYNVNSTSKPIKTDLAERLLTEMAEQDSTVKNLVIGKGKAHLLRAVKIVDILNVSPDGPWEGRIQNVNNRKVGDVMISESSFNESLKPILGIPWLIKMNDSEVAKMLNRYWEAIFSYTPNAFDTPRSYSLQKTIGTYTWHLVAPAVFETCRADMEYTTQKMIDILKPAADYLEEVFWEVGNTDGAARYSSRAGFVILSQMILETLPEATSPII